MTPERQAYIDSVRSKLANGEYRALLQSEGETVNSAKFKRAAFGDYRPTANDVIVSTYPKSGTNWTMQIAYQIAWLGQGEFDYIHEVIPWPGSIMKTPVIGLDDLSVAQASPTGMRVIKSHEEAEFVPLNANAKYIAVVRDPKDVLVSAYHFENEFFLKMVGDRVPLADFIAGFLAKEFIYISWASHTAGWWGLRQRPNVIFLFFEEMKNDPHKAIRQIAELMGITLTSGQFNTIAEKSSYAWMKANDRIFSPPTPPDYQEQGSISMVRSGKTGEAGNALTAEQRQAIDAFCQEELLALGSDFPYQNWYR